MILYLLLKGGEGIVIDYCLRRTVYMASSFYERTVNTNLL